MRKILLAICFLIVFFGFLSCKRPRPAVDPAFRDRILEVLDSKGDMTPEEKERIFSNMRVAGGSSGRSPESLDSPSEEEEEIKLEL